MTIDPLFDFFHYTKHGKEETFKILKSITKNCDEWCPFTHNPEHNTDFNCYQVNNMVQDLFLFLDNYYNLFVYLEVNPLEKEILGKIISEIKNPISNENLRMFKQNIKDLERFVQIHQKNFYETAKKFTCLESERLNESMRCFKIHAYYASVILAVTSIESRIHTIIRGKYKKFYDGEIKDFPIGKIINLRDPNQYKEPKYNRIKKLLKEIIPEKHIPLIKLLNSYRIVSAHPRFEEIDYNISNSILSLSFAFLLDPNLEIPKKLLSKRGHAPAY